MGGFLVGYRTYIAAALMAVFGILANVDWNAMMTNPAGLVAVGASILMAVLRSITTTPPAIKPEEPLKTNR